MGIGLMPRILTRFKITWCRPDQREFAPAQPVNLSVTGSCLNISHPFEKGDELILSIALSNELATFEVKARVAWCRPAQHKNTWYIGLGFLNLSSDNQQLIQEFEKSNAENLLAFISEFPLFAELTYQDCHTLIKIITLRDLSRKEILFRQGQTNDDLQGLFIVQNGLLNIYKGQKTEPSHQLGVVSAGQVFGETTLVNDQPHSATVQAVNDTTLIQISKIGFAVIRKQNPALALKIMEVVAQTLSARLGRTTKMLFAPIKPGEIITA